MAIKKYISLEKLAVYDEKIKKVITDGDAAALKSAKDYADSLASNYEVAGSAATAEANAKAYADTKDAAIAEAKKAGEDAAAAAAVADGKAVDAQTDVDNLEAYVGTFTASEDVKTVVEYIDAKTANIASDETVSALADRVAQAETDIDNIEKDYLKAVDKEELVEDIAEVQTAVDTEKARAEGIEAGLRTDVDAIKGDYLKTADKTALQNNIDGVAGRVATIEGDYLKTADKTALEGKIDAKADQTALDAEIERATQAEAGLQTQINTIMNNPDTEGVINSINEFTQYIADHGEIADGFRADINANTKAISDHEALAAQTYETKEDATAKYDEVKAEIAAIPQADWNQNDPDAADYVKNRTHYEDGEQTLISTIPLTDVHEGSMGSMYVYIPNVDEFVAALDPNEEYQVSVNGKTYALGKELESDGRIRALTVYDGIELSNGQTIGLTVYPTANNFNGELSILNAYGVDLSSYTVKFYKGIATIKQLDEKFIPDTIARVTAVDALKTELQGKIDAKADASALTSAVEALDAADAGIIERVAAVEALMGDGDGSVADQIADAKAEVLEEMNVAVEAAKTDASNKDAVVLAEAQKASTAVQTALDTHTGNADIHVTAEKKSAWDAAAGKAHEHSNLSVLEGITSAKVTEWDKVSTKADQTALQAEIDRATAAEAANAAAIAAFVEVSEEEINNLFA